MGIVLFRVDERLIHGQVVVGWGSQLHPDVIMVVDDEIADSPWEQELYGMGLPSGMEARFASVQQARGDLAALRRGSARTIVLTRDVGTMRRLAEADLLRGEEVNVGGIHYAPGRERVLPYVYLSDAERDEIAALTRSGVQVSARDLPGTRRVAVDELLRTG